MFEDHNVEILEILRASGRLNDEQISMLQEDNERSGKSVAQQAIDDDLLSQTELLHAVGDYLGFPVMDLIPTQVPEDARHALKGELARRYGVVPLEVTETRISLITRDPFNHNVIDDLTFSLGRDVELYVVDPTRVEPLILEIYGEEKENLDHLLSEISDQDLETTAGDDITDRELEHMANETPIIRFVNLVLQQAIKDKASDIHFEPYEDKFRIRYRIDGALYEMAPPPKNLAVPVISRVKVLSNLNIAERRIPQDGRIKTTMAGRPVDLRVSTLPTQFGESVVLRVLDKSVVNLDLDNLSMPPDILGGIRETVKKPNGIFIVTGPTGSGKTTTLYSALREVNAPGIKILTAEDPVEYEIDGIMQVGVNHQVGLTFAKALRSFLRQDPDKIMVGEIRDLETAQIAVQAALTGHVVLSTLHTNDAAGAVTRLIDMGLEPFLISASLEAILAQRLVRRIDPDNRVAYEPEPEMIEVLGLDPAEVLGKPFFYGKADKANNHTGYRGRIGLFEMLMVNDTLRELINEGAPTLKIRQRAVELGMRTLRDDGIRAILDGDSTVEEVLKYT